MFMIAPQIQTCVGPVAFPDFLAHILGNATSQAIASLESKRIQKST